MPVRLDSISKPTNQPIRLSDIPEVGVRPLQAASEPQIGMLDESQTEFVRKSPVFLRYRAQWLKERKKAKDTLVEQVGLSMYNKLIATPSHDIAKSDLDAAGIKAHEIQSERMKARKKAGGRRFPDQWLEDEWKEIRDELYLPPEARDEKLRKYPAFQPPKEDTNPLAAQVEASKPVEIGTDIASFVVQLTALQRIMPSAPPEVVWEAQGLLTGSKPGEGAATYAAFNLPSKLIPGISKAAKAGRVVTESATLAGISAIESKIDSGEVDWKQVAIGAGIPVAMRSPKFIKALLRKGDKKVIKAIAEINPELIKRLPSQRELIGKKPRIRIKGDIGKRPQVNVYKTVSGSRKGITEAEVIRKGERYIDKVTGEDIILDAEASTSAMVKPETTVTLDTINKKLSSWVKNAKALNKKERREAVHKLRQKQRAKGIATYKAERKKGTSGFKSLKKARAAYAGKADIPEIDPISFSVAEKEMLTRQIDKAYSSGEIFKKTGAYTAFEKMQAGKIPTPYEFGLLDPIIGHKTNQELFRTLLRKKGYSGYQNFQHAIQFFKLKFGFDIQTPRQMRTMLASHPIKYFKATGRNIAGYVSNKYAENSMNKLLANPDYKEALKYERNFVGTTGDISRRLEYYGHGLTERFLTSKNKYIRAWGKVFEASERGAVTGINSAQLELHLQAKRAALKRGLTGKAYDQFMINRTKAQNTFIKILRAPAGTKGKSLRKLKELANIFLFSPSVTASRPLSLAAPFRLKGSRLYSAQVIATNIASIALTGYLTKLIGYEKWLKNPTEAPDVDGSGNPINSMFGKIRKGTQVYDTTMGDAAFYRTIARIGVSSYLSMKGAIEGKKYTEFRGKKIPSASDTLNQYINTRETAIIGTAKTMITGKDWLGQPIPRWEAIVRALSPEFIEAIVDAGMADGTWAMIAAGMAAESSIGVNTYEVPVSQTRANFKDLVAKTKYNKLWNELSLTQQMQLQGEHKKQFDMFTQKVKQEKALHPRIFRTTTEEQEIEAAKEIRSKISKENREKVKDVNVSVSRYPKNYYLNDERYNKYKTLVAKYIDEELSNLDTKGMPEEDRLRQVEQIVKAAKKRAFITIREEDENAG